MTVYFHNVFNQASEILQTRFYPNPDQAPADQPCLIISQDSGINLHRFSDYRATHLIRDPRDLIVSAYFYHLRTGEKWCAEPNPKYHNLPTGVSYQQHLRGLPQEAGLLYELANASGGIIEAMADWDYHNPRCLELRYEELLGRERQWFRKIFRWYGFSRLSMGKLVQAAERHSLSGIRQHESEVVLQHVRAGSKVGQWREYFSPRIKAEFKSRYGETLIALGYENSMDW